ncbi:hypothetical protein [Noviherbaspirillum malthae]|uniref:hypothetical protein n=1 Tax=Noviherbaspirillum malthae TaxID=1260987 RepID=UPI00188EB17B|nr:hypothetical protein [Noviherbaspirillum malthae]
MTDNQIRRTVQMLLRQMQGLRVENIIIPLLDQVLAGLYHLRVPSFCMTLDRPATLKTNRMIWTAGTRIINERQIVVTGPSKRVHLLASCHADPEDIALAASFADVLECEPDLYRDLSNDDFRADLEASFCPPVPRYRGDVD